MTPEQRERVEAALSDHAMAFAGLCAMERTAIERAVEVDWLPGIGTARKKAKDTQKALLATVSALVSEAVAAERARWEGAGAALTAIAHNADQAIAFGDKHGAINWRHELEQIERIARAARPHPHTEEP